MALEVELEAFDGPLDLLLSLIEKDKINIFDIPIAEITDQYLDYVRKMEKEDLGTMSEFMVMAAELISIKCKMLLPREKDEKGEEIDPRDELVRQLLDYKTARYMGGELKKRMDEAGNVFRAESIPKEVKSYRPPVNTEEVVAGITLEKLHQVFSEVLRRQENKIDPVRSRFGTIEKEEVSLPEKLESVAEFARRKETFSFRELLTRESSRTQIVVTFLAMLELMKYGYLRASQEETDGDIFIERVPEQDLDTIMDQIEEDT
ncbi:MAG: segregation/condensation protein A [Lachnospiraceae bacterium]|nr:segregation/condensation protein A [Lachnospiraceae bacterium]